MNVSTRHPQYLNAMQRWQEARHVIAGGTTIKQNGEVYLPRLLGDNDDAYDDYKTRAVFFNATGRTLEGFIGLIFRRAPLVQVPKGEGRLARAAQAFLNDVDLAGTTITEFAKATMHEVVAVGRAGTLIDWSESEERAYLTGYKAEQIINWRFERVNGRMVLTLLALHEPIERPDDSDVYMVRREERIRVFRLVRGDSLYGGIPAGVLPEDYKVCLMELYQKIDGEWRIIESSRFPLRQGKRLTQIPFVFHAAARSTGDIGKLPLSDLIEVNLSHYRLMADYRHGMHYAALPTAWAAGVPAGQHMPPMGSATVWENSSVEFRCGFLEFKGDGLQTLERALDRDERLLAVLGSRLLEPAKRVGETAEAIELRQSGESSVLASLAGSVSDSLSAALRWVYWWHSGARTPEDVRSEDMSIALNRDFSTGTMQPNELRELVAAFQAQVITQEELVEALRRGEVIAPNARRSTEAVR